MKTIILETGEIKFAKIIESGRYGFEPQIAMCTTGEIITSNDSVLYRMFDKNLLKIEYKPYSILPSDTDEWDTGRLRCLIKDGFNTCEFSALLIAAGKLTDEEYTQILEDEYQSTRHQ